MEAEAVGEARRPDGAGVRPRWPSPAVAWTLRDVLPQAGSEYRATVERVWRDREGRLLARFTVEGGRRPVMEVWVQRGSGEAA